MHVHYWHRGGKKIAVDPGQIAIGNTPDQGTEKIPWPNKRVYPKFSLALQKPMPKKKKHPFYLLNFFFGLYLRIDFDEIQQPPPLHWAIVNEIRNAL